MFIYLNSIKLETDKIVMIRPEKNVCIVTTSRADYGLLKSIINSVHNSLYMNLQLIVTGAHLMEKYGNTYKIIEQDFPITKKIYMQDYSDSCIDILKVMGHELGEFPLVFKELMPDILILLGDRYEILAPAIAATIMGIELVHMCGGDITLGAYDNQIRDCVSMLAHIHFPTSDRSKKRLLNFGKHNVYLAGHPCLEKINKLKYKTVQQIAEELRIVYRKTNLLVIYHPETLSYSIETDTHELIEFLNFISEDDVSIFIIGTNIDTSNMLIRNGYETIIDKENIYYFESLDQLTYLSLAKSCDIYIGNSSSGIYELPYLIDSIVNIGDRQAGRELASNILCCPIVTKEIIKQYNIAKSTDFRTKEKEYKYKMHDTTKIVFDVLLSLC